MSPVSTKVITGITSPQPAAVTHINLFSQIVKFCFCQDLGNQKLKKEVWQCRIDLDLNPTSDQCVKTVLRLDVTTAEVSNKDESIFTTPW